MNKIPLRKESIVYLLFLGLITIILYIFIPILSFILFLFVLYFFKGRESFILLKHKSDIVRGGITVIGVIK